MYMTYVRQYPLDSAPMGHKEALLEGARKCLEEKGYARTTARDIVAASDTNLASIGYHFGSKEALLNAAIAQAFEEWTDRVEEITQSPENVSPLEQMAAGWIATLDSFEEHRALLVAFVESIAQAERSPELRAQLADHYHRCREQIGAIVRASLGPEGEQAGADADTIASFLMAVVDGLVLQWLLDPERTPDGQQLVAGLGSALELALRQNTAT
jgi:AcrR family transcriptional regulator